MNPPPGGALPSDCDGTTCLLTADSAFLAFSMRPSLGGAGPATLVAWNGMSRPLRSANRAVRAHHAARAATALGKPFERRWAAPAP